MKSRKQTLSLHLANLRKIRAEAYVSGDWDQVDMLQCCIDDTEIALKEDPANDKIIPLSKTEHQQLERAMQWPEDRAAWDRFNTPTNFGKLFGSLTVL